jgi:hypothetical protein
MEGLPEELVVKIFGYKKAGREVCKTFSRYKFHVYETRSPKTYGHINILEVPFDALEYIPYVNCRILRVTLNTHSHDIYEINAKFDHLELRNESDKNVGISICPVKSLILINGVSIKNIAKTGVRDLIIGRCGFRHTLTASEMYYDIVAFLAYYQTLADYSCELLASLQLNTFVSDADFHLEISHRHLPYKNKFIGKRNKKREGHRFLYGGLFERRNIRQRTHVTGYLSGNTPTILFL